MNNHQSSTKGRSRLTGKKINTIKNGVRKTYLVHTNGRLQKVDYEPGCEFIDYLALVSLLDDSGAEYSGRYVDNSSTLVDDSPSYSGYDNSDSSGSDSSSCYDGSSSDSSFGSD